MSKHRAVPGLLLLAGAAILCLAGGSRADEIVHDDGRYSADPAAEVWHCGGPYSGRFVPSGNGKWVETSTDATFYFREVAREQGFVELYDESRAVTVRLYDKISLIRHRGTGGQFVFLYARQSATGRQDTAPPSSGKPAARALDIKVLEDDWGGAPPGNIQAVCLSVAGELSKFLPDRQFDPITVTRSKDVPMVIYGKGWNGERRVKLNVAGTYWGQFSYQFGHEFGHILCNYRSAKNPNIWFEESLCETAAIFAIRRMAKSWRERPPYPRWKSYAGALEDYADAYIRAVPKVDDFAAWYEKNEVLLREFDRPSFNVVAVRALLPLLEKNPEHWNALRWLNRWDPNRELTFVAYLADWHGRVPEMHKEFVADIAKAFNVQLVRP